MDNIKSEHKTFRNLFTRVAPNKREKIKKDIADTEIKEAEDKAWDEWEELNKRTKRIHKKTTLPVFALIFLSALFFCFSSTAFSFGIFNIPYNRSDPNFNKLAMRVYNSNSPYTYTWGAYTYNALPITTTLSGCKLISIIRRTKGFSKPAYWAVENYKICSGSIAEVRNTNMAGWDNLPQGIKPVINNTVQEARQYGHANANYYGYRVIAKTGAALGTVFVYVLNGFKLEAVMRF